MNTETIETLADYGYEDYAALEAAREAVEHIYVNGLGSTGDAIGGVIDELYIATNGIFCWFRAAKFCSMALDAIGDAAAQGVELSISEAVDIVAESL